MSGYVRVGTEFVVNSTYARSQAQSDTTRLTNGDYVVTWIDANFDTTADRYLRAQVYHADGTTAGGELTLAGPLNGANNPTIAGLANGGFVAFYQGMSGLTGAIYSASGEQVGSTLPATPTLASMSEVMSLANGGFAVVWHDTRATGGDTSGTGIHVTTYDQSGLVVANDVLVNTITAGNQGDPSIAALAGGGYVVTWTDRSTSNLLIKAQIFDAVGAKSGGEFTVNPGSGYISSVESSATTLANGNFAVGWFESGQHHVQVYTPTGLTVGAPVEVAAYLSGVSVGPQLTALSNGGFVLTWTGDLGSQSDGSGRGIYFQAFDADAHAIGSPQLANTTLAGDQIQPSVVALDDGSFAINWTDVSVSGSDNDQVRGQIFQLDTSAPPAEVTITSGGGGATSIVHAIEGDTAVAFVTASAPLAAADIHYAITGGQDAALFTIDASTGLLRFAATPDFEAPTDANGDNVYDVVVTASDGVTSDSQVLVVQLDNMNDAPVVTSSGAYSVGENSLSIGTVAASDVEGETLRYYIMGGADASLFTLNSQTGALSFTSARDFESPTDSNGDNIYVVTVKAQDTNGSYSTAKDILVSVTNVLEGTTITSNGGLATAAFSVAENQTYATTVIARDNVGPAITYSISGGNDAAKFTINAATGILSFVNAPDYEAPNDFDRNRVYNISVAASDGQVTDTQALSITVTNVNEAPIITSYGGGAAASISVAENSTLIGTFSATDPENNSRTFSIVGGADAARFAITASGVLTPVTPPNYEAPTDANGDNVYEVVVQVSDGALVDTQAVSVAITNVNEGPAFASPSAFSVQENLAAVGNVTATDPENQALIYSITGGVDAARFTINAQTGALSFVAAPNFETPIDNGANNVYNITVGASDGSIKTTQSLAITVTNVNEAPAITSNGGGDFAAVSVAENSTVVATVTSTDPENTARTYSIAGGADAARFAINAATGALSFIAAPDREAPTDTNGDNVYDVVVRASDGILADTQTLAVTVTNVDEVPRFTSPASLQVNENAGIVGAVAASDPEGSAPTYAITGGADAAKFTVDSTTGVLSFVASPDFEAPGDADRDNRYEVTIVASDGSLSSTQTITVTVGNANEAPVITSPALFSAAENGTAVGSVAASDADGDTVAYAITGGADASRFAIDAQTGALSFVTAPNFEAPGDADHDNVYNLIVTASDGAVGQSRTLAITVTDVDEAPVITSNGGGDTASISVAENTAAVTTVASIDPQGFARTYAITGGADASRFAIDVATGVLSFVSAPNFEARADTDGNNVYDVVVTASNGILTDSQALAVHVADANEAPTITSNGGGDTANLTVNENTSFVTTMTSTDPEGTPRAYTIAGGEDAAKFVIDHDTGALSFASGPNFEAPADADGNNVYQVVISASDNVFSDTQAIFVRVANVADGLVLIGTGAANTLTGSTAEDTLSGLAGRDTLIGGAGADTLIGGIGADLFQFKALTDSTVSAPDFIADFSIAEGDRIALSALDANVNRPANQAFTFIGTSAFTGVAGQLHYTQSDGDTFVSGDVNGDKVADFMIQLDQMLNLSASNFIL